MSSFSALQRCASSSIPSVCADILDVSLDFLSLHFMLISCPVTSALQWAQEQLTFFRLSAFLLLLGQESVFLAFYILGKFQMFNHTALQKGMFG